MVPPGWQRRLNPVVTAAFGAFACHVNIQVELTVQTSTDFGGADLVQG